MKHVLIVDDDMTTRILIGRTLNKRGFVCTEADNGHVGYKKTVWEQPDLILLDLTMPKTDGFEALSLLKSDGQTRSIPVVVLTWESRIEDMIYLYEMGASGFLVKPIFPDDLEQCILRVLGSSDRRKRTPNVEHVADIPRNDEGGCQEE